MELQRRRVLVEPASETPAAGLLNQGLLDPAAAACH